MNFFLSFLSLCLITALAPSAGARDVGQDEALQLRQQQRIIPLEVLMAKIYARYPHCNLLEVDLEEDDDIYIYEVELVTQDGVVREMEINAKTGKILQDEEDD